MNELFVFFLVVGFFYFAHLALFTIGGNAYDIFRFIRNKKQRRSRQKRFHPLVTVIIPAYNEELVIERCLKSIIFSSYDNIETIVVSDHSTDNTNSIVRRFITKHPGHRLQLIVRRSNQGKGSGLNYAINNYASGEIIMVVDADCIVDTNTIANGVRNFINPKVASVASNVRILEDRSILNLVQIFEYMVSYRSKKFYTLTGSEMIIGGVGSYYRKEIIKKYGGYDSFSATEDIGLSMKIAANGNANERLIYDVDSVVYTESVMSFKQLVRQRYRWKFGMLQNMFRYAPAFVANRKNQNKALTYYRLPVAFLSELLLLMEPVFFTFILSLTIATQNLVIFSGAYLILTAYVSFILFSDEHMSLKTKLVFTPYLPYIYFLFYIMSLVQLIAAIRSVATLPSALVRRGHSTNTWLSPTRNGARSVAG